MGYHGFARCLPPPPPPAAVAAALDSYNMRFNNARLVDLDTYVQEVVVRKFPALDERDARKVAAAIMNRVINASIMLCDTTGLVHPDAYVKLERTIEFYRGSLLGFAVTSYLWGFCL